MTDASWETLSNQAVAAAGVVYFLALIAHLVQWARCARCRPTRRDRPGATAMAPARRGRPSTCRPQSTCSAGSACC